MCVCERETDSKCCSHSYSEVACVTDLPTLTSLDVSFNLVQKIDAMVECLALDVHASDVQTNLTSLCALL